MHILHCTQVQGSWTKYVNKETTTAFVSKQDPNLTFPTLAFCSDDGIRRDNMIGKLNLSETMVDNDWSLGNDANKNWIFPRDKKELDEWFRQSTFSKEEVIKGIQ